MTRMVQQRAFGQTGLRVSEIGMGCGPTARLMIHGDERERTAVIARALEYGINYFDTAARYGDGLSEINLGRSLHALSARPIIATKVTLEDADLGDLSAAVEHSVESSLTRLGREEVEIVHLHNRIGADRAASANIGSGILLSIDDVLGDRGVAEGLSRLRQRGLVRVIGACAFGGEIPAIASVIDSGIFSSWLVNYSLLNQTAWIPGGDNADPDSAGIAAGAARQGNALVALRVLEAGELTGRDPTGARAGFDFLLDECTDYAQAAIRFALSNQDVSTALVGISDSVQLDAAVAAAELGSLSADSLRRLGKAE